MAPVLVVDDDPTFAQHLARMVSPRHPTVVATDVASALRIIDAEALSGLVADYLLDDTRYSGLRLAECAAAAHPGIPTAIVTGVPREDLARAAAAAGIVFIPKPFGEDALAPLLLRALAYDLDITGRVASVAASKVRRWGLTPRETEILYWHLAGHDVDSFIAEKVIAKRTYKAHVSALLAKARAGDRLVEVANSIFREAVCNKADFHQGIPSGTQVQ